MPDSELVGLGTTGFQRAAFGVHVQAAALVWSARLVGPATNSRTSVASSRGLSSGMNAPASETVFSDPCGNSWLLHVLSG